MSGETRPPIDQELLRKVLESSPFFRHLKMEFVDAADGVARLSLAIQPFHINTQGIVQGGVLCSLADVAGLLAVGTRLSLEQRPRTVQMDIHFLAPAQKGTLTAAGRIAKMGSLVSVSDVEIQDEAGKTVCMARCTSVLVNVSGDGNFLSKWGRFANRPYIIPSLEASARPGPCSLPGWKRPAGG